MQKNKAIRRKNNKKMDKKRKAQDGDFNEEYTFNSGNAICCKRYMYESPCK